MSSFDSGMMVKYKHGKVSPVCSCTTFSPQQSPVFTHNQCVHRLNYPVFQHITEAKLCTNIHPFISSPLTIHRLSGATRLIINVAILATFLTRTAQFLFRFTDAASGRWRHVISSLLLPCPAAQDLVSVSLTVGCRPQTLTTSQGTTQRPSRLVFTDVAKALNAWRIPSTGHAETGSISDPRWLKTVAQEGNQKGRLELDWVWDKLSLHWSLWEYKWSVMHFPWITLWAHQKLLGFSI